MSAYDETRVGGIGGDARAVGRDVRDERTRDVPDVRGAGYVAAGSTGATTGADNRDRSIGDLLKELRDESSALLRQEVALAKTEMGEKAAVAGRNAVSIGTGAAVAYAGAVLILAGLTIGLALLLDWAGMDQHAWWVAPLVVGAVVALIGYGLIQKGVNKLKDQSAVPEKTVQSLQEDKQWLQEKVS
jgi:hypothetical protein